MGFSTEGMGGKPHVDATSAAFQEIGAELTKELKGERISAEKSAQMENQTMIVQGRSGQKEKKEIKARASTVTKLMEAKDKLMLPVEAIKDEASKYERRNPELKATVLQLLRERIKPGDTKEDILKKLAEFYPDVSLADEALEFLLDTTDGELHQAVREAKDSLNQEKGREIAAGRNIQEQARAASDKGLGTPSSLRDMYRDITGNPRDAQTLFSELSQKYAYKELTKVIQFLFHSLGADMKSKGPSIPPGELHNLISETRTLQAIMGVYRFFKGRMALTEKLFKQGGLDVPSRLTFEAMSKSFMTLAGERYPSADKMLALAKRLEIDESVQAKIIVFSQFRDSVRELAISQIYRSVQHRDELFMSIIEGLEDLEEELEEIVAQEESENVWEEEE